MITEPVTCLRCGTERAVTFHTEADGTEIDLDAAKCTACGAQHGLDPETQVVFLVDERGNDPAPAGG